MHPTDTHVGQRVRMRRLMLGTVIPRIVGAGWRVLLTAASPDGKAALCVLLVVPPLRLRKPVEALRRTAKPDAGSALLEVAEEAKQTCHVADQIPLRNAW